MLAFSLFDRQLEYALGWMVLHSLWQGMLRKVEAAASDLDKDIVKIARGSLNLTQPPQPPST